ncbi:MAG: hypothetical protein QN632_02435 [Nitrososphaeraceae archaeon]|nr:hypothetical protein [Nitrososphaeraceae archaeon]
MKSKTLHLLEKYLDEVKEDLRPTSKTFSLMKRYMTFLEQGESPPVEDPSAAPDPNAAPPEGSEAPPEEPEEEPSPETTVAENQYVSDVIAASLFKPSPEQMNQLYELQNVMSQKQYSNARQDILPLILPMIRGSGQRIPVSQNPPNPENTMPLTPEGEDQYISDLIDAAIFKPSSEDANTLLNLQSVMKLQRYTNSREEVLPTVLSIIGSSTQAGDLKTQINDLGNIA